MAGRNFLFVPGPTNVPDRVARAMMVADGGPPLPDLPGTRSGLPQRLEARIQDATAAPILFPSSGTGCWEAALTNCLNAGDKVLTSRFGQFSHLWVDMCARLGYEVEVLETPWGEGAPVERYLASLERRQAAQDQGRAGMPERNRHRSHQRRGRRAPGDGQRQASGAFVRRLGERARQHRLSHGRMGRGRVRQRLAKRPDAARRPGRHLRQPERRSRRPRPPPRGAATSITPTWCNANACGYFPYTPVAADAVRPARVARHARRGGPGERLSRGIAIWRPACAPPCSTAGS